MCVKLLLFLYPSIKTFVLGTQKNRLIETVLLSTHNICFGWEIKKIVFQNALISGALVLLCHTVITERGAQWLSWFEAPLRHCLMSLSKTLYPLLSTGSNLKTSQHDWKLVTWRLSIISNISYHYRETGRFTCRGTRGVTVWIGAEAKTSCYPRRHQQNTQSTRTGLLDTAEVECW